MDDPLIYHLCRDDEWRAAEAIGVYGGSSQDQADGFIHFSTGAQIVGSAAKHRAAQPGLLLIAVDPAQLGPALKWEPSRNGALFQHLYGTLRPADIRWTYPLALGTNGQHIFPEALQDVERVS